MFLRNEGELHVVDFDRVESKNLASQFHTTAGLGRLKVQSLAMTMNMLWRKQITTNHNKLIRGNERQLVSRGVKDGGYVLPHLMIDCLDNGASRRVLQQWALDCDVPLLHGAIDAAGTFGRVGWTKHSVLTDGSILHKFGIDDEEKIGQPTCENGENLPMVAIVSGYIAKAAQAFLRDGKLIGFQISPGSTVAV